MYHDDEDSNMNFENIKNDVDIIFENHPKHDSLIDKISKQFKKSFLISKMSKFL